MIFSPEQLALNTSTARIASQLLSNSAMAQSFYDNQISAHFSLYLPYQQLTDGRISTSAGQFFLPTQEWGTLKFSYADNSVENLNKPVYSDKTAQFDFARNIFQRFILALSLRWNTVAWYSDLYPEISLNGFSVDFSAIYILDGYSSIGVSAENVSRPDFSDIRGDSAPRGFRFAYNRVDATDLFSVEGGVAISEDSRFETCSGGFFSAVAKLPYSFSCGLEYKYLNNHSVGAFLGFLYKNDHFQARISYAMRIDDAPLPVSTFRQAFGIQFLFNRAEKTKRLINPQLLFRDDEIPHLTAHRLSDYAVLKNADGSDKLQVEISTSDRLSGIAAVNFEIIASADSTEILYTRLKKFGNFNAVSDTLTFDGVLSDSTFLDNGYYYAKIITTDQVGNRSKPSLVPFQLLAPRNDNQAPVVEFMFDTSSVYLGRELESYILNSRVSIMDRENTPVSWKIVLMKSVDDSTWDEVNPVTGWGPLHNRNFEWLLRTNPRNPITGRYKIKIEAKDALNNLILLSSRIKKLDQEAPDSAFVNPSIISPVPETVGESEQMDSTMNAMENSQVIIPLNPPSRRFGVNTTYWYRGKTINLSNFIFEENQPFDTQLNHQGLNILGIYLQEIPNARIVVQYTDGIGQITGFEKNLITFLKEAYGISRSRIQFKQVEGTNSLHFTIIE